MVQEMRLEERTAQNVVCVRQTAPERLVDQIGKAIEKVVDFFTKEGIQAAGPPYARSTWEPGTDLEIGFPVTKTVRGHGDVVSGELPAGKVAVARHVGPRDTLDETTSRLRQWISEQGLTEAGVPWETYLTNPSEVLDPARWETDLVYPVR
jgi:effector-binding domain-containing protein